jgi:hypothetical protein
VDLYVHSLRNEQARTSFEAAGLPLLGSVADWTKTTNGVIFSVGRDDLVCRVEQRFDGRSRDDQKIDAVVLLEFSEFGKARSRLSPEVQARLAPR